MDCRGRLSHRLQTAPTGARAAAREREWDGMEAADRPCHGRFPWQPRGDDADEVSPLRQKSVNCRGGGEKK